MTGFSDKQIIAMLGEHSLWSKRACREILRRKEDFIPLLLGTLDQVPGHVEEVLDGGRFLHIPAAFLLAQMREKRACPLLVKLAKFDDKSINLIWGDVFSESFDIFLRDTFDGDTSPLRSLAEDRSVSPWSRIKIIDAYGLLYADGHVSREEAAAFFRRLILEVYAGKPGEDDEDRELIFTFLANTAREHHLTELADEVRRLYEEDQIDITAFGPYEVWLEEARGSKQLFRDEHIDDTIRLLEKWRWFTPPDDDDKDDDDDFDDDFDDDDDFDNGDDDFDDDEDDGFDDDAPEPAPPPPRVKTGRNDPCPCGSGKKYKHCHGSGKPS